MDKRFLEIQYEILVSPFDYGADTVPMCSVASLIRGPPPTLLFAWGPDVG